MRRSSERDQRSETKDQRPLTLLPVLPHGQTESEQSDEEEEDENDSDGPGERRVVVPRDV